MDNLKIEKQLAEIQAMLVVLYKRIDAVENKLKNTSRMAGYDSITRELDREVQKVMDSQSRG